MDSSIDPSSLTYQIDTDHMHMTIALTCALKNEFHLQNIHSVGCCIRASRQNPITKSSQVLAIGWNGVPQQMEKLWETKARVIKREDKCPWIVHAEANAIRLSDRILLPGATLYTTQFPCTACSKLIVQSHIKRVIYLFGMPSEDSIQILNDCDVSYFPFRERTKFYNNAGVEAQKLMTLCLRREKYFRVRDLLNNKIPGGTPEMPMGFSEEYLKEMKILDLETIGRIVKVGSLNKNQKKGKKNEAKGAKQEEKTEDEVRKIIQEMPLVADNFETHKGLPFNILYIHDDINILTMNMNDTELDKSLADFDKLFMDTKDPKYKDLQATYLHAKSVRKNQEALKDQDVQEDQDLQEDQDVQENQDLQEDQDVQEDQNTQRTSRESVPQSGTKGSSKSSKGGKKSNKPTSRQSSAKKI